jgi:hypothetical protein
MSLRPIALLSIPMFLAPLPAVSQQTPETIVAAAVRAAGHECAKPAKPVLDPKASKADEKVWLIQCGKQGYRVRFVGDQGAKVEPVPGP